MKRKRGNKRGKKKGSQEQTANEPAPNVVTLDREDNSGIDGSDSNYNNNNEDGKDEYASRMEVDTPSSTGTDQPLNVASINPDGSIDKTTGKSVGRVKVKLKTSKTLESHSDTDKSSLQLGLDKHGVVSDKMEDSGSSLPEVKMGVPGNISKKPGSIKITSFKGHSSLNVEKSSNAVAAGNDSVQQKEVKTTDQGLQYNKEELDSALLVIKKVMKMEAAEPFNVPVNPEALGIPDYFDIIDTPMDFGTICSNLENGNKYANSEEVYKDVQYIWDNCYKYNNKGDYILDLMRRVKKNFMKYWTAAALYTEQATGADGAEGIQGEDVGASKSGQSKQKNKKRHGRRHKADCLCAICVLKRRRREREESTRLAKTQIEVADYKLAQQLKQEDSSPVECPHHEDSLSDESLGADADIDIEEKAQEVEEVSEQHDSPVGEKCKEGVKEDELEEEENEDGRNVMETQKELNSGALEKSQVSQRSGEELNHQSQLEMAETAGPISQIQPQEQPAMEQQQEQVVVPEKNKQKELQERQTKAQIFEKFHFENPLLLSLCGTLFSEDHQSVWSGPHSLFQHQASAGRSSIHAAINKLMK